MPQTQRSASSQDEITTYTRSNSSQLAAKLTPQFNWREIHVSFRWFNFCCLYITVPLLYQNPSERCSKRKTGHYVVLHFSRPDIWPQHVSGAWAERSGAERAENRVEQSGAWSGRGRKRWSGSAAGGRGAWTERVARLQK